VILQHPRERFHPLGTVRFAKLGLENVSVVVATDRELALPPETALLYPAPGARLLSEVPAEQRPKNLLVLDGTWSQARSLYKRNRWLTSLPHFDLQPKTKGRYRIRLEPDDRSLSTIEAIVEALQILEPENVHLDGLLTSFTRMIDRQVDYARTPNPRMRRRRGTRLAPIPRVLREHPERIVLGYGEFALPHDGATSDGYGLMYWAGLRLGGEAFQAFVRPKHLPSDRQLKHVGFSREQVEAGCSIVQLQERWREFMNEGDVLVAWNKSTLDLFAAERMPAENALVMKTIYCNARKTSCGSLDQVLALEGLAPIATPFVGRPALVMSRLWSIARMLIALR
jgi:DTW domain-containing protein